MLTHWYTDVRFLKVRVKITRDRTVLCLQFLLHSSVFTGSILRPETFLKLTLLPWVLAEEFYVSILKYWRNSYSWHISLSQANTSKKFRRLCLCLHMYGGDGDYTVVRRLERGRLYYRTWSWRQSHSPKHSKFSVLKLWAMPKIYLVCYSVESSELFKDKL